MQHLISETHQIQFAFPDKQRPHNKYSHLTLKCEKENYPWQFQFNPNHNEGSNLADLLPTCDHSGGAALGHRVGSPGGAGSVHSAQRAGVPSLQLPDLTPPHPRNKPAEARGQVGPLNSTEWLPCPFAQGPCPPPASSCRWGHRAGGGGGGSSRTAPDISPIL